MKTQSKKLNVASKIYKGSKNPALQGAINTLKEANIEVVFECTKCYERFSTNECEKHCKKNKHYSFRLLGTHLIRSFA